jgi:hypothetical protein
MEPLRQSQGFIDSIFGMMGLPLDCPDFSTLSKRLRDLNIKTPRYKKTDKPVEGVHAIAIDSTGLKRFGRGEWHQEKYEFMKLLIIILLMQTWSSHPVLMLLKIQKRHQ